MKADGSDIMLVTCRLIDRDGTTVPYLGDRLPILFHVEGEGEIVGDELIGANPVYPEAGIATVMVRSAQEAGEIVVYAGMLWPQWGGLCDCTR